LWRWSRYCRRCPCLRSRSRCWSTGSCPPGRWSVRVDRGTSHSRLGRKGSDRS
jgi:hypothetical protein